MPVRAIGRTNSGMFASRASAAAVHRTGTGSPAGAPSPPSVAGIIAANGQLGCRTSLAALAAARASAGPIRTPSDWTTCVSYALVSIAIS